MARKSGPSRHGFALFCPLGLEYLREWPHIDHIDQTETPATTYLIVPQAASVFGVEVTIAGTSPTMVTSFATVAAAETWIAAHKHQAAKPPPKRLRFRNRK